MMTQDQAFDILVKGENVFLTGEPGSGKTYTVNRFVRSLREKNIAVAVTASTGIAATHLGGRTIHSWSGIGTHSTLTSSDLRRIADNKRTAKRIRETRVLVIDEISMLSADTFSAVEATCRKVRGSEEPFGGLQIVLVGDFFQLPPIVRADDRSNNQQSLLGDERARSPFAFSSSAWERLNPAVCYLSEQYRHEDPAFLELLGALRRGALTEQHRMLLRQRPVTLARTGITQLYTHNVDVDLINERELAKLSGETRTYTMEGRGPKDLVAQLVRGCLSPESLAVKIGARVMCTKNDPTNRFVNGTIGAVVGFHKESNLPIVKTLVGRTLVVEPQEWKIDDGVSTVACISQVPLRLAWALTVHKSQGMSLDAAHMDLSRVFEYGQGYVALSRVRTLAGITLAGMNERALQIHPAVRAKDDEFRARSAATRQTLHSDVR
ncbi:MAG: PIF1 family DEAD/DEAH box helicase [Patescibacteria group bacterium]